MNELEIILSDEYKKKYTYFTGNGTTALYLIFKSLDIKDKKIVFPNITCMAPVNAAIYAGYEVLFCDVNIDDFNMNIDSLREIIENQNVGIVVPTHLYGHKCDTKTIYNMCKKTDVIVVEDAAQSVEASDYNDFSITSFGHTKIFETENGGGAIFYNDESFLEKFNYHSCNLISSSNNEEFKLYLEKYYNIVRGLSEKDYYTQIKTLQLNSKEVFLRHFKDNNRILDILKSKERIVSERKKRAEYYLNHLDEYYFIKSYRSKQIENTLWRFSILVKNMDRDKFVSKVRKKDIDISTWYPCLHRFYSEQDDEEFKNSIYISDNIVNFWITEKYSEEKILHSISGVNKILKRWEYIEE